MAIQELRQVRASWKKKSHDGKHEEKLDKSEELKNKPRKIKNHFLSIRATTMLLQLMDQK
jgi:hypothetical protein